MTVKLKSESYAPLDITQLLETDQQVADFLQMLLAEGSPKEIAAGLGTVARSRGMSNVAREVGVSRGSLYRALSGEGNPEFATILNVNRALNLQLTVVSGA